MKIYIIDDEQISIFIIQQKLFMEGIAEEKNVHGFLSPQMALDFLVKCRNEELPDIIFLDLSMPEMDGWQFLDFLVPLPKVKGKCRIYILTTSLNSMDEARAKEHSLVSGFFQKPISTENIRKIIA